MSTEPWTGAQIRRLHQMVVDRVSYRKIGKELGRSRSAICSKVRDLQIGKGRPKAPSPLIQQVKKMPLPPKTNDAARILARHKAVAATTALWALVDLGESQCHFPFGDPLVTSKVYCGQPAVPGLRYCPCCVSRVYQPAEVRHVETRERRSQVPATGHADASSLVEA